MIKHDTASVFVFHHDTELGWRVGFIFHPIFDAWMQSGGHVETTETPFEAALREAREETGLAGLRLIHPDPLVPAAELPTATPMPLPVWIIEHPVPNGDNHVSEPHVHIDFKFLAVADDPVQVTKPDHPFEWFTREQATGAKVLRDVRVYADALFDLVEARQPVA